MGSINLGGNSSTAAHEALDRGYQPTPIYPGTKRPQGSGWTHKRFDHEEADEVFGDETGIGLVLGEPSGGLVDVDLDHPIAWRIASHFLPPTRMRTGRAGNPSSHYWYRVTDSCPASRPYKLADGTVAVELRSTGGQTLIPPTTHPSGEQYRWEAEPWGGEEGPAQITGAQLRVRVASLALVAVLIENWPGEGGRHDAYLALAGGMLRFGNRGVHPYWSRALPQLVEALAEATHDKDGTSTRVYEVIPTTESKLFSGVKVQGWPTLEGIIGEKSVAMARKLVEEIEGIVDWKRHLPLPSTNAPLLPEQHDEYVPQDDDDDDLGEGVSALPGNPLDDRAESWEPVNLEPYIAGEVEVPRPTILRRDDGVALFYPGRVNSLYGRSESAKTWVAQYACLQEMSLGERVVYVDLEDEPAATVMRLKLMGGGDDDIRYQFIYVRPEGPLARMERDRWGNVKETELGHKNAALFREAIEKHDPGLVVVDGMSVLYGLHGLDTNDVTSTDVITNWLKSLCANGRRTVIIIDHTGKGAEKGAMPIGSQHKISMVQGTALQVAPVVQPKPGGMGHVELVVGKDRHGGVRAVSSNDKHPVAADVFIDSTVPGITRMTVQAPRPGDIVVDGGATKSMTKFEALSDLVPQAFAGDVDRWLTGPQIRASIPYDGYGDGTFSKVMADLVQRNILRFRGQTVSREYALFIPEAVDD